MTITARLADGRNLEFPDGTDPSVIQATVKRLITSKVKAEESPTGAEQVAGNPLTRFALGAASPFIGATQLASNAVGLGETQWNPFNNARMAQLQQIVDKGRGDTGFDPANFAGSVLSPAGLVAGKLIKPAASVLGRVGQGAGVGLGFGASAPVTQEGDYWGDKGTQAIAGTALGGVIPAAVSAGGKVFGFGKYAYRGTVEPFFQGGRNMAEGRNYVKTAGDRAQELSAALKANSSPVPGYTPTAAEVAASLPASATRTGQAEFAGLQGNVTPYAPSTEAAVSQGQGRALADAIRSFGQDKPTLDAAIAQRGINAGQNYSDAYAQQIRANPKLAQLFSNPYVKDEVPIALKLAEANGITPKSDLTEFLHYVKIGLDKQLSKTGNDALSSTEQKAVQSAKTELVNWIAKANPKYETARSVFAVDSVPINQMQIGQALEGKLTSALQGDAALRPGVFANAIQDTAKIPQTAAGLPKYTSLSDALTAPNMQIVNDVADTLATKAMANKLASMGSKRSSELTGTPELVMPSFVNYKATMAKHLVRLLQGKGTLRMDEEMARDMLTNTPRVAQLMDQATNRAQKIQIMVDFLRQQTPSVIGGAALNQGAQQ